MKSIAAVSRVKVSADGHGVVSHAGVGMLRELADLTGLSTQVTAALADTYRGPWIYEPGAVFADLAAAVADGADCIDAVGQRCGDREHVFGPAASTTTMWRPVDERIDAAHLPSVRAARASARAAAWAAGAAPAPGEWLHLDVDATITIDQSDNKENAAATWKKTWGHHSLLVFLDRPEIAGGEGLSGLLRPGNAGSNTAADHVTVLEQALESLPAAYRPDPDDPGGQQILVRSDSAGATHAFADACRTAEQSDAQPHDDKRIIGPHCRLPVYRPNALPRPVQRKHADAEAYHHQCVTSQLWYQEGDDDQCQQER